MPGEYFKPTDSGVLISTYWNVNAENVVFKILSGKF